MPKPDNPYRAAEHVADETAPSTSHWTLAWIAAPSVWTFMLHLPAVDPIYFHGIPLLLHGMLPGPIELLIFFLAQWPFALGLSAAIAAHLSNGNKYLGFGLFCLAFAPAMIVSQILWTITPFSWR